MHKAIETSYLSNYFAFYPPKNNTSSFNTPRLKTPATEPNRPPVIINRRVETLDEVF